MPPKRNCLGKSLQLNHAIIDQMAKFSTCFSRDRTFYIFINIQKFFINKGVLIIIKNPSVNIHMVHGTLKDVMYKIFYVQKRNKGSLLHPLAMKNIYKKQPLKCLFYVSTLNGISQQDHTCPFLLCSI